MTRPTFEPEDTHVSGRRWIAHGLDGVILGFVAAVLLIPFAILSDVAILIYFGFAATFGVAIFYTLVHNRDGQSPGKRICAIRVVDGTGNPPSRSAMFKRSLPFAVDFTQLAAFFSMQTSDYRQRLGDRWAGTYVIDATPEKVSRERSKARIDRQEGRCPECGTLKPAGTSVCPSCGKISLN